MKSVIAAVIALFVLPVAFAATEKKIDRPAAKPARPLTVTLDVKDEEVRDILKSMQRQCRIKNLVIDPQVQGKATFFFRDLPCATAFNTVFRTLDLKSITYSSSLATVEKTH
jgi:type II secretory pathway component GspD/PulD (secretin)